MDNLELFEKLCVVPENAKKEITAGRLKGFTDINPMWRIMQMTDVFGPCGIGWWYEITNQRIVDDATTKQRAVFVDINLYFVDPVTGDVSKPIPGIGGSMMLAQENKGPYLSDECFKCALTDAISVATKALGMAGNVYFDKDRTKYTEPNNDDKNQSPTPRPTQTQMNQNIPEIRCVECGVVLDARVHDYSVKKYGRPLCRNCQRKQ